MLSEARIGKRTVIIGRRARLNHDGGAGSHHEFAETDSRVRIAPVVGVAEPGPGIRRPLGRLVSSPDLVLVPGSIRFTDRQEVRDAGKIQLGLMVRDLGVSARAKQVSRVDPQLDEVIVVATRWQTEELLESKIQCRT